MNNWKRKIENEQLKMTNLNGEFEVKNWEWKIENKK